MEYNDNTVITWGIHKDKKLANIPADYLIHLYNNPKKFRLDNGLKRYIKENEKLLIEEASKAYPKKRFKLDY